MSDQLPQPSFREFIAPLLQLARPLAPLAALVLTLAWASGYDRSSPQGPDISHFDKIAHFFVYGLLGTLAFRACPLRFETSGRLFAGWGIAFLYGVVDELIQLGNPLRSFDGWDMVADGGGAMVGILVYRCWRWYRELLETPLFGRRRARSS